MKDKSIYLSRHVGAQNTRECFPNHLFDGTPLSFKTMCVVFSLLLLINIKQQILLVFQAPKPEDEPRLPSPTSSVFPAAPSCSWRRCLGPPWLKCIWRHTQNIIRGTEQSGLIPTLSPQGQESALPGTSHQPFQFHVTNKKLVPRILGNKAQTPMSTSRPCPWPVCRDFPGAPAPNDVTHISDGSLLFSSSPALPSHTHTPSRSLSLAFICQFIPLRWDFSLLSLVTVVETHLPQGGSLMISLDSWWGLGCTKWTGWVKVGRGTEGDVTHYFSSYQIPSCLPEVIWIKSLKSLSTCTSPQTDTDTSGAGPAASFLFDFCWSIYEALKPGELCRHCLWAGSVEPTFHDNRISGPRPSNLAAEIGHPNMEF